MIRILHVVHSLGMGGMEKGIATVVSHASEDVAHEVLCLTSSGEAAKLLPPSTRVHEMNMPAGNSLRFILRLAREFRSLAPDIIHTRNWGGMDAILAARWARRSVVHGEHGWDAGDPDGRSRKRRFLRRALQGGVREFTCVSRHIERWLGDDVGIKKPITQIYNGVDTDRFRPGAPSGLRRELGIDADTFVVGIVARLDPIKDHESLIEAICRLRDDQQNVELVVIGDGPRRDALRELEGPGLHLVGHRANIAEAMGAFDVFVLPSRNEGISNTILEAMAAGLPVIASRVGGNPELVDDGVEGALFDAGDVGALAELIRRYAVDRDQVERAGSAARRRALDRYSIRAMVDGYETVWRRVAGRAAG